MEKALEKRNVKEVMDELQGEIALDKTRRELALKLIDALKRWEGKQINKRVETYLKGIPFPNRLGFKESYGVFRVEFYGNTPASWGEQMASFEIGHTSHHKPYPHEHTPDPTPGRISLQYIKQRNIYFLENAPARIAALEKMIDEIPRLVETWNSGIESLLSVKKKVEGISSLEYGSFGVYITKEPKGEK